MSRGRPHHQSSRRRAYTSRQREVRERHLRTTLDPDWLRGGLTPTEVETEVAAADPPPAWGMPAPGRARAA